MKRKWIFLVLCTAALAVFGASACGTDKADSASARGAGEADGVSARGTDEADSASARSMDEADSASTRSMDEASAGAEMPMVEAEGESVQLEEKTEVRRENFPDSDGSGHGHLVIYYSDGSTETEEY